VPAPALRDLEGAFWRALARRPGAEGGDAEPELLACVQATPRLAAHARIAIYTRMYFWRLLDVLREDFSHVAEILGDERFADAVRGYLARHPSEDPSIRHAGRAFAEYLAAEPPPGAPPFAAELARLEWTRLAVFDAPDASPLTLDDLRALPPATWPELALDTVPAFALLVFDWPVHRVWASADEGIEPSRTVLRVWRDGFAVYHSRVEEREEAALERLRAGETFGGICEAFADLPADEAAARAGTILASWVQDGLVRVRR
jgi:hypothetical protein